MRIGIVTQPLMANYGCLLQNYALQQVLRQLGHEPVTLDFLPVTGLRWYVKSLLRRLLKGGRYQPLFPKRPPLFDAFVQVHIATVPAGRRYRKSLLQRYHIDALIVGSDQVWRRFYNPETLEDMFLAFAGDFEGPRIAYAASFGTGEWDARPEEKKACAQLVKRFRAVSVREPSGVRLCREQLGVEAVLVPDPVRLLSRADYLSLCEVVPVEKEPYIAAYVLDETLEAERQLDAVAKAVGLLVRRCTCGKGATLTVEQWLALFRDAAVVVTDSFHGAVIAGIFGKDCKLIENPKRGLERFETLKTPCSPEEIRRQGRAFLEQALNMQDQARR